MAEATVIPLFGRSVAPRPDPVAQLDGVRLSRGGRKLLDRFDFTVPGHGITALVGANGAGKSLTLRLIAGLIAPDAGRIDLAEDAKGRVALVFQKPVLLRRSVRANLAHALRLAGVPWRARRARLDELLALGRLEGLAQRPARVLSGGEQARVALVRALAQRPRLLLLDEPAASLDPHATAAIETLVRTAVAEGVAVVLVSHDPGQVRRLADRVAFLHRGRIVESGAACSFFVRPESAAGRAYLDGRLLL
ncbi:MAG: ATP-binding cassette domain-containing protein [Pseudomonadota bacterium]